MHPWAGREGHSLSAWSWHALALQTLAWFLTHGAHMPAAVSSLKCRQARHMQPAVCWPLPPSTPPPHLHHRHTPRQAVRGCLQDPAAGQAPCMVDLGAPEGCMVGLMQLLQVGAAAVAQRAAEERHASTIALTGMVQSEPAGSCKHDGTSSTLTSTHGPQVIPTSWVTSIVPSGAHLMGTSEVTWSDGAACCCWLTMHLRPETRGSDGR